MTYGQPPVVLTFLAPAERCNQRCPACYITEVVQEPVQRAELQPAQYARFVEEFVEAGIPILGINFQGYEVTLPDSWPYVEAVFRVAQAHQARTSFITNGTLLHKYADRIEVLDPVRIAVSLDGSSPEANDPIRGLPGAFQATRRSLEKFLRLAPRFRDRLVVASTLYSEVNFQSLLYMPALLNALGISRWVLGVESHATDGLARPVQPNETLVRWLGDLQRAGTSAGVSTFVNDELGLLKQGGSTSGVDVRSVFDPRFLYRLDPLGYVRSGQEILKVWRPDAAPRWTAEGPLAPALVGYEKARRARKRQVASAAPPPADRRP